MISKTTERSTQATQARQLGTARCRQESPAAHVRLLSTLGMFKMRRPESHSPFLRLPSVPPVPETPPLPAWLHSSRSRSGHPNSLGYKRVTKLVFSGVEKNLRRCHRNVGGCNRFDVRPIAIITAVPEDDNGFVLEQARAFGEFDREKTTDC